MAHRLISRPAARIGDGISPYYDHGLDAVIQSHAQRKALMKAQGVIER